jgi:hypothetical protein
LVAKVFFQKKTSPKPKIVYFGWKFSTKESKLAFPTNLTILYPNPQKKFQLSKNYNFKVNFPG